MPQFTEMRRPALWDDARAGAGLRAPQSRTVVLGYDGSGSARRALARAADAAGSGGRVVVVTAVQPEPGLEAETAPALGAASSLLEEASDLLAGRAVDISTRAEDGEPAQVLIDAAREVGAAMIVVGARGDDYLARALRGSVGERLVARAPCDLLVVR